MFEKILKKQSSTLPLKSVISDVHFIYIRLMFCLTLPWWKARCERAKRVNIDVIFWWYLLKCANLKRKSFLISIAGSRHINFLKKLLHTFMIGSKKYYPHSFNLFFLYFSSSSPSPSSSCSPSSHFGLHDHNLAQTFILNLPLILIS